MNNKLRMMALATTALTTLGMFGAPVQASEKIKLQLGGFMGQVVGWSQQKDTFAAATPGRDYQNFDQKSASEIYVSGETKLDNGITVGMKVEFEADSPNGDNGTNSGREFDESYMFLSSATLGRLELGSFSGPAWNIGHRAPNATLVGLNTGDVQVNVWIAQPGEVNARTNAAATGADDSSIYNRVNYTTPTFMGFAAGFSYVPDAAANNNAQPVNTTSGGVYRSAVIAYDQEYGGLKVGADIHAAHREGTIAVPTNAGGDTNYYGGGLNLSYAGFTVGGSFERILNKSAKNAAATNGAGAVAGANVSIDGHKWDAGVSYETGPYKASFTYTEGENQGLVGTRGNDKYKEWVLGLNYALGAGVDLNGAIFSGKYADEGTAAANNNDGYGVQAGILLSF